MTNQKFSIGKTYSVTLTFSEYLTAIVQCIQGRETFVTREMDLILNAVHKNKLLFEDKLTGLMLNVDLSVASQRKIKEAVFA